MTGIVAALRYARYVAMLAPIVALAFVGWHYLELSRSSRTQAARIELLTAQVKAAQGMAIATAQAAEQEIQRAEEIIGRERAAAGKLRVQLDRISRASGQCLDERLPIGLVTP